MMAMKSIKNKSSWFVELKVQVLDVSSSLHHLFLFPRWHLEQSLVVTHITKMFSVFLCGFKCLAVVGSTLSSSLWYLLELMSS